MTRMFSSCPFCHMTVPFTELEWHANNHFAEDELERDMALARQLALAPPSPRTKDKPANYVEPSVVYSGRTPETSIDHSSSANRKILDQEISCLVDLQIRSTFYEVEGGLMALLRRCLELESENSRSIVSGHIDHYQIIESEDAGWGCGWRNIQMLSSHLLKQRQEAKVVLFGGSGFVPDIPSLQRWLEIAWERGFDTPGSESFDHKIYGSRKWIGAIECATLFRSFGLRARIVDFDSTALSKQLNNGESKGKKIKKQVYGPMDKFLLRTNCDDFQVGPSSYENSWQEHHSLARHPKDTMINGDGSRKYERKINGHQVLVDWVWNYFTSEIGGRLDNSEHVLISNKTPLYIQHDGHSRIIVGIQMQRRVRESQNQFILLVLDPAHRTAALERSLRDRNGWQQLIKRGVHTFKKPQYQLCYVDPGVARGEEMEQLKTINSILIKF
ncbi:zinc finger-containing ubiquitin peptidase 1 isoform X2 [Phoenix dactylifera]|uniref:Zinc finger-containing ubiquitin peptidase 1 isoform X2 n=1 Tax=Phoenix dactylifera TaxID=42345 RepID=A0A8B7D0P9_PHODC|nr:zinc finger-containing ubiquitin peptidase 1 isoform X2 [Phoenix dactylifera]